MDFKKRKMNVWFTADTHCGHGNIIKYCHRPFLKKPDIEALESNGGQWHDGIWKGEFASRHRISQEAIDEMNNVLIDNINKCVAEEDTLWHLGDFAFAPKHKYIQHCEAYRNRIRCKNVKLVFGNHDQRDLKSIFPETYDLVEIKERGYKFVLCHYAMAVFNKSHRGAFHLYGHSHSGAESWMDRHMPNRRSMDVGVDNIAKIFGEYRPISLEEVISLLGNKKGHAMDHHQVSGPEEKNVHT